jgi:predicted RecB family nuclease
MVSPARRTVNAGHAVPGTSQWAVRLKPDPYGRHLGHHVGSVAGIEWRFPRMHIGESTVLYSPSDLNHFLECEHLVQLARTREGRHSGGRDPHAELLAAKGLEHEQAWLHRLQAEGRLVEVVRPEEPATGGGAVDWERDAQRTLEAMRAGADVIYQGVLLDEGWRGISDFLIRIDTPSELGAWSYEAWDTKLARRSKPYFILQLCFYSAQLARMQGIEPAQMHVVLGTGARESFRYRDFAAYYRAVRRRFLEAAAAAAPIYPYPVAHCRLCDYARVCDARWHEDDHLSLVAGIRRDQVRRLNEAGVQTMAQLATFDVDRRVGIGRPTRVRLQQQAALQAYHRRTGEHRYELLPADEHTGFRLLPVPSPGDVFFDMEGDPYYEPSRGLEYLVGAVTIDAGLPVFTAFQGLDRDQERTAFEGFIDFVHERLRRWPDLHVYHYAAYEITALKRLMSEHGTREDELDDLLRREVFVDLYQVVRQSLRISHSSYSIKKVRTFFMAGAGQGQVTDGGDSILEFERWRASGDPAMLDAILRYNEEDCISTLQLRDWLIERRQDAARAAGVELPWKAVTPPEERKPERAAEDEATRVRREALMALSERQELTPDMRDSARLLADLLNYHRREAKPEWWAYFERRKKSLDNLIDDTQAIARLESVPGVAPERVKRSLVHLLRFPPQEFKLSPDSRAVEDPFQGGSAGTIEWIDMQAGTLGLKRGPSLASVALPHAIVAAAPIDTKAQRGALGRVADALIGREDADGTASSAEAVTNLSGHDDPRSAYAAILDMLARRPPRIRGVAVGAVIQTERLEEQHALAAALDSSCLVIQGPPGSGKTWTGARLIVRLLREGRRVGVAANSHKAINNLLAEVETVAAAEGVAFDGLKKGEGEDAFGGRFIRDTNDNAECESSGARLIAGTGWLFSRPGMDRRLDYLFIDEAGQVALADAVAMGTAARNLVLMGDPQQLPQVRQGVHPGRSGCSVLEHLLDGAATVAADRGLFLGQSYRMHPDVCRFVSELSYDGRLDSAPDRERQRIDAAGALAGAGLRFVSVPHADNAQQAPEEAQPIAVMVTHLLDTGRFTDVEGRTRPLTPTDVLVVAPYNMQVRCLAGMLPDGVEVGTVDRFQGREAPVVFFSMTSSSGDDVPRGLEFLFSRNRLNVAISRARALAIVVASPRLLEARCTTVEQMRLVNAACRFVEHASPPALTENRQLITDY